MPQCKMSPRHHLLTVGGQKEESPNNCVWEQVRYFLATQAEGEFTSARLSSEKVSFSSDLPFWKSNLDKRF